MYSFPVLMNMTIPDYIHIVLCTYILYCVHTYCIVYIHIVLCTCMMYCVMRPYSEGRLDRYRIGIPLELSEVRTQPWLSEGSLTCDPCHHRGPII